MKTLRPSSLYTHNKRDRRKEEPGREWYNTTRWRKLRKYVLIRDKYICQWPDCGRLILDTSQAIANHIKPHKGDEQLFWDEKNLETVCKDCHDGPIAQKERREELKGQWY